MAAPAPPADPAGTGRGLSPARLIDVATPEQPAGVVLVLHGGGSRGRPVPVSASQLSVLRMIPIASRVASAGDLAVLRLLNTWRGWNPERTPLQDLSWALDEVTDRFGPKTPIGLVGHSLGGRTALMAAGDPRVSGVVALAPWVYSDDAPRGPALQGTPITLIHGDRDRVASIDKARAVANRLAKSTEVEFHAVPQGQHAMLRQRDQFDVAAARAIAGMLAGKSAR